MPPKAAAKPAAKAPAKAAPAPKAAAAKAPAKAAAPAPKAAAAAAPKAKAPTSNSNGVYVKNWGNGSVADAKAAFAKAGNVVDARIRRGKYALVWFDNSAAVKKAVDSFNNKEVCGSVVTVNAAKSGPKADKHEGSAVVFVQPIFRESTPRSEVFKLFSGYSIKKLRTYRNNSAFVYFDSAATAQKAIKDKNGAEFKGKKLSVKASTRSMEEEKKRAAHSKLLIDIHHWKQAQAHH